MPTIPAFYGPTDGEAAVLSMVAVRESESEDWAVASGSLLTVPVEVATMSWPRWKRRQFPTRGMGANDEGLDPGPIFSIEPSAGVRGVRVVVWPRDWDELVVAIETGSVNAQHTRYEVPATAWSPVSLLAQDVLNPAHRTVAGANRPVSGVVATLDEVPIPPGSSTWQIPLPPGLEPGRDRGQMHRHRTQSHWPAELLGIDWLGTDEFAPPPRFVVGRSCGDAWIADVVPDFDNDLLEVSICWDENRIDPLACTLSSRSEFDGTPILTQQLRISELPSDVEDPTPEARKKLWHERVLNARIPRGPRRTSWGVSLISPSGQLLDERPVVARAEQMSFSLYVNGSDTPASTSVIGDRRPPPSATERSEAAMRAVEQLSESTVDAAQRRFATAGELRNYLRWRFACRAGELRLLDPYLLRGDESAIAADVAFLVALDRPVRALTRTAPDERAAPLLAAHPQIEVQGLPDGQATLHDRIWIVGQTALMTGASLNHFLREKHPATTVSELPFADAVYWERQFDKWWSR
ncbi:MAG: hypothetical protein WD399_07695 [Thermoleophilaceae bacterium]